MNRCLRTVASISCLALGWLIAARAATEAPPASLSAQMAAAADADEAYARFEQIAQGQNVPGLPPQPPRDAPRVDHEVFFAQLWNAVWDAGRIFLQRFPEDPRRWQVVQTYLDRSLFTRMIAPGSGERVDAILSRDERALRRAEINRLTIEAQTAADVPEDVAVSFAMFAETSPLAQALERCKADLAAKRPLDLAPFVASIEDLARRYPQRREPSYNVGAVAALLQRSGASNEAIIAEIERFRASPNELVRETAGNIITNLRLVGTTPEVAFTALDGREVDLAKLRGKVVLIDFWATWCGPCKAELPNIKAVFTKYYDQGFEVIGITAEKVPLSPQDTPELREKKIATARQVLVECVAEEQLPWPQHFSEFGFRHPFFKQFGVTGIPLLVLIGKDGKVISTNIRGESLEPQVRQALGL